MRDKTMDYHVGQQEDDKDKHKLQLQQDAVWRLSSDCAVVDEGKPHG